MSWGQHRSKRRYMLNQSASLAGRQDSGARSIPERHPASRETLELAIQILFVRSAHQFQFLKRSLGGISAARKNGFRMTLTRSSHVVIETSRSAAQRLQV